VVVPLLTGTVLFLADLIRHLPLPLRLDFLGVSSYGAGTEPGRLVVTKELRMNVRGRTVLLVDDILDTGRTLLQMRGRLRELGIALILNLLEIKDLANRQVSSLSPGETKKLTIAVEMASNPSVLFLDEPTSGLDALSASQVVRCLRRLAMTGRTIICTIHQPSADVFFSFDQLMLLAPGGWPMYAGPTGPQAATLVGYLESLCKSYNDFFFHYTDTPLLVVNTSDIDFVNNPDDLENLMQVIRQTKKGTVHYQPLPSRK
jgi:hypothetical protein